MSMQNTGELLKLIAEAQTKYKYPLSTIKIVNNTLYIFSQQRKESIRDKLEKHSGDVLAFSMETGKALSPEQAFDNYKNFYYGLTLLDKDLKVNLPMTNDGIAYNPDAPLKYSLSYGPVRYFNVGKYKIVTFSNSYADTEYKYDEDYGTVKNLTAVVIWDKENKEILYARDNHAYPIFDVLNNAVWYFDSNNPHIVEVVIVHPDRIEKHRLSFDEIIYPEKSSLDNNDKSTITNKQWGVFVRNGISYKYITVLDSELTEFSVPFSQSVKISMKRNWGFQITRAEPFIVSKDSYMLKFTMKLNKRNNTEYNVIVSCNMDKYISKDDRKKLLFASLIAKKGNKEIFVMEKYDKQTEQFNTCGMFIDGKTGKKQVLFTVDTPLFYSKAHIGEKHMWVFVKTSLNPVSEHFMVYDIDTGKKVYYRHGNEDKMDYFYLITSANDNKNNTVFLASIDPDDTNNGIATVLNTETLKTFDIPLKDFAGLHHKRWDVFYGKDAVFIGYWIEDDFISYRDGVRLVKDFNGYALDSASDITKIISYFAVCYVIYNNKVYSLMGNVLKENRKGIDSRILIANPHLVTGDSMEYNIEEGENDLYR
jgi:hypothetical protein